LDFLAQVSIHHVSENLFCPFLTTFSPHQALVRARSSYSLPCSIIAPFHQNNKTASEEAAEPPMAVVAETL
jgi:hypothetical protein